MAYFGTYYAQKLKQKDTQQIEIANRIAIETLIIDVS